MVDWDKKWKEVEERASLTLIREGLPEEKVKKLVSLDIRFFRESPKELREAFLEIQKKITTIMDTQRGADVFLFLELLKENCSLLLEAKPRGD